MIPDITYPPESYFYPYHVIIAIITSIIFLLISFLYRQYLKTRSAKEIRKKNEQHQIKAADILSLGALIGTIIFTGLYPFLLSPLLDYTVSPPKHANIEMVIDNFGVYPAKNVVVSLNAHGAKFTEFISEPALPNSIKITNQNANGIFEMAVLPPRSQTNVTVR